MKVTIKSDRSIVELHPRVVVLLEHLNSTGLYGDSLAETAERGLSEWLAQKYKDVLGRKN